MNISRATLTDIFIDPISLERMQDPVINTCGHTYERTQIDGWIDEWMKHKVSRGPVPECPLCRAPISRLIQNRLVKEALEVIDNPDNDFVNRFEELTDEEQDQVFRAIDNIRKRREEDQAQGIPDRLAIPEKFITRVAHAVSQFYGC